MALVLVLTFAENIKDLTGFVFVDKGKHYIVVNDLKELEEVQETITNLVRQIEQVEKGLIEYKHITRLTSTI